MDIWLEFVKSCLVQTIEQMITEFDLFRFMSPQLQL